VSSCKMREFLLICSIAVASSFTSGPLGLLHPTRQKQSHYYADVSRRWPLRLAEESENQSFQSYTREDLESRTVAQLKELLRTYGLKVSGRKAELLDRLMLHYDDNDASELKSSTEPNRETKNPEAKTNKTPTSKAAKGDKSEAPTPKGSKKASAKSKAKAKLKKTQKDSAGDGDARTAAEDLAILEEASRIAAEESIAAAERGAVEDRAVAEAKAKAEIDATKPKNIDAAPPVAAKPVEPLKPEEEVALAARLATMDDLGDRAFEVLKNLGLVEDSSIIDPSSPDYDSSRDDEIADGIIYLD